MDSNAYLEIPFFIERKSKNAMKILLLMNFVEWNKMRPKCKENVIENVFFRASCPYNYQRA